MLKLIQEPTLQVVNSWECHITAFGVVKLLPPRVYISRLFPGSSESVEFATSKINSVFDSVIVNRINDWSGGFFSRELICKWDKIF